METQMQVQEEQLKNEAPALVQQAQDFKVTTDLQAEDAAGILTTIKSKLDAAKEFFAPMVEAAHAVHKAVCTRRNEITEPLEGAVKILRQKVADYTWKKQQAQKEKEEKAAAEAKAKEDAKKAELLEQAKKAEKAGDLEKADQLTQKAADVYVAPRQVAQASRPSGFSVQGVWEAEVVEEAKVPRKWWGEVDLTRLKRAKAADETLQVPGIKFTQRGQGSVRGSK